MKNHLYCLFFFFPLVGLAQPSTPFSTLEDSIRAFMETHNAPGAQIAIFTGDQILWQQNFGKANIQKEISVTDSTFFRIGSVTKMFVAVAALQLVEQGKLSLNDKLIDLAPEIDFQNQWQETHPIQIKHLLEHTTGFDDMHLAEYATIAEGWTLQKGIKTHPDNRYARWKPGLHSSYCNSGPPIVAYIIEKITGQDFEDYVTQHILRPLGMHKTSFVKTPEVAAVLAQGYAGETEEAVPYWQLTQRPAGSMNSNMQEMIPFVQMLIKRGQIDSTTILSSASVDRMETCQTTLAGKAGLKEGYGLHNYTTNYKGIKWHGHDGGMLGFLAKVNYSAELDIGFITLINSTGAAFSLINDAINEAIFQEVQGRLITPSVQATFDEQYLGYYRSATSRNQMLRFLDYIAGIVRIGKTDDTYYVKQLLSNSTDTAMVRTKNTLTVMDEKGYQSPLYFGTHEKKIYAQQVNDFINFKKVSMQEAFTPLAVSALFILLLVIFSIYALIWIGRKLIKKPVEGQWALRLLPLIAFCSLGALIVSFILAQSGNVLLNLGTKNVYSISIFLSSIVFGGSILLFCWRSVQTKQGQERAWFRALSMLGSLIFIISILYLFKEGIIGLRTWTY